jgi:hypothetical protein
MKRKLSSLLVLSLIVTNLAFAGKKKPGVLLRGHSNWVAPEERSNAKLSDIGSLEFVDLKEHLSQFGIPYSEDATVLMGRIVDSIVDSIFQRDPLDVGPPITNPIETAFKQINPFLRFKEFQNKTMIDFIGQRLENSKRLKNFANGRICFIIGLDSGATVEWLRDAIQADSEIKEMAEWLFQDSAISDDRIIELNNLFRAGVDIDSYSPDGYTALMNAALCGNPAATKFLLEAGANKDLTNIPEGETVLDIATRQKEALQNGVSTIQKDVNDYEKVIQLLSE